MFNDQDDNFIYATDNVGTLDTNLLSSNNNNRQRVISLTISFALKTVAILMSFSSLLGLIISVANKQEPLWPLMNISQYAANYPAIYFFRIGTSISAILLIGISHTFFKERQLTRISSAASISTTSAINSKIGAWTILGFLVAGIGLGGAGLISCFENNDVHTSLAFAMFIAMACIQTGQITKSCASSRGSLLRCVSCMYLWFCLLMTILMASHVVEKVDYLISILEWTATIQICIWAFWFSDSL